MKKLFENFPYGSPMHIVLHAQYRRSRRRRPVVTTATERNPRCALQTAERALRGNRNGIVLFNLARPCVFKDVETAAERAGLRFLTQTEVETFMCSRNQPVPRYLPSFVWDGGKWREQEPDESWNSQSPLCFSH